MTKTAAPAEVDPILFAVLRHGLVAATRKAFTAFERTAMIPILYEGHDFAVSLYDDRLELVAETTAIPVFAGALGETVPRTVEEIGRENIAEGDILLTNLPWLNGSHPPDAVLVAPIFAGGEPAGFMALRAHMGDLGGESIWPTKTHEVFQEGLLLPPLKLYDAGVLNETVIRIIRTNSRIPVATAGDFLAGAGAVRTGAEAVRALLARYGVAAYRRVVDQLLDHGERVARRGIERIRDGVYTAEGALDDNGVDIGVPVPLKVTVTVAGSNLTIDTTGSAPQQAAPINCPWAYTQAVARLVLKTLATSDIPSNSGEYRVLTLIAPRGSMFNPLPTAASFRSIEVTVQLTELILAALAPALPEEIPAMSGADLARVTVMLNQPRTGRPAGLSLYLAAPGFGARRGADGANALFPRHASAIRSVPVEVLEIRDPVVRSRFELDRDSGGPGRWRGGLGMVDEVEFLGDGSASTHSERTTGAWPVLGLEDGLGPPRLNGILFYAGTEAEIGPAPCKRSGLRITAGTRYRSWTSGGGGLGHPFDRDPAAVAWDVKNDYVSRAAGQRHYGVVIADDGEVDVDATAALRQALAELSVVDAHLGIGTADAGAEAESESPPG